MQEVYWPKQTKPHSSKHLLLTAAKSKQLSAAGGSLFVTLMLVGAPALSSLTLGCRPRSLQLSAARRFSILSFWIFVKMQREEYPFKFPLSKSFVYGGRSVMSSRGECGNLVIVVRRWNRRGIVWIRGDRCFGKWNVIKQINTEQWHIFSFQQLRWREHVA